MKSSSTFIDFYIVLRPLFTDLFLALAVQVNLPDAFNGVVNLNLLILVPSIFSNEAFMLPKK